MKAINKLLSLTLLPFLFACNSAENITEVKPVGIDKHDRCHLCGMMITKYPGPKAELTFKNSDTIAMFCSSRDMFNFALQAENKRQISHIFVHDAGATDWVNPSDSAFIDAKTAYYVYGTSKKAVMGSAVAPFSSVEAAENFAKEYGGKVLEFDDISLDLLATKG